MSKRQATRRGILLAAATGLLAGLAGCSGAGISIRTHDDGIDIDFQVDEEEDASSSPTPAPGTDGDPGGAFRLDWTIRDASTGDELSCAAAGATRVSVLSTLTGEGGQGFDNIMDCEAGQGQTETLPLGEYETVFTLLDDSDASLAQVGPENAVLDRDGQVHDFGTVAFEV